MPPRYVLPYQPVPAWAMGGGAFVPRGYSGGPLRPIPGLPFNYPGSFAIPRAQYAQKYGKTAESVIQRALQRFVASRRTATGRARLRSNLTNYRSRERRSGAGGRVSQSSLTTALFPLAKTIAELDKLFMTISQGNRPIIFGLFEEKMQEYVAAWRGVHAAFEMKEPHGVWSVTELAKYFSADNADVTQRSNNLVCMMEGWVDPVVYNRQRVKFTNFFTTYDIDYRDFDADRAFGAAIYTKERVAQDPEFQQLLQSQQAALSSIAASCEVIYSKWKDADRINRQIAAGISPTVTFPSQTAEAAMRSGMPKRARTDPSQVD